MRATTLPTLLLALVAVSAAVQSVPAYVNDNNVLNYALTLENFESRLYLAGLAIYNSPQAFTSAGFPVGTFETITFIGNQEVTHASNLNATIYSRGWPAVPVCHYNFAALIPDVRTFVQSLVTVENAGTRAYNGASNSISSDNLLELAAGIATVEGRHTAILNYILSQDGGNSSFPNAFDQPLSAQDAYNFVSQYIISCPYAGGNNVTYAPGFTYFPNVSSSDLTTYAFKSVDQFRGDTSGNKDNFYYGASRNTPALLSDIAVLNYALTLEHLEATFYRTYASAYNVSNIQAAGANLTTATLVSLGISAIAAHENTHVTALTTTITNYGQTAATECAYNFSNSPLNLGAPGTVSFFSFLQAALTLENTGVSAYVGAINLITNEDIAQTGATIATVEGRHAAFLAEIYNNRVANDSSPVSYGTGTQATAVPQNTYAADTGLGRGDVAGAITPLLSNATQCLGQINLGNINGSIFSDGSASYTNLANNGNGNNPQSSSNPGNTGSATALLYSLCVVLLAAFFAL